MTAMLAMIARPLAADPLADTIRVMAATPPAPNETDLAAHEETTGHWQFATRNGDRFTVSLDSHSGELARALDTLAPDHTKPTHRLILHLTAPAIATRGAANLVDRHLKKRPPRLRVVIDGASYFLRPLPSDPPRPAASPSPGPNLVELTPGVHLSTTDLETFREIRNRLSRPLPPHDLRVVAFDPSAPHVLTAAPRIEATSRTAFIDPIAPAAAEIALATARRQVMIVTGTIADDRLLTKSGRSPEVAIPLETLRTATARADATLIVLDTGSSAQPGGRNLLWLPVSVPGLDAARDKPTLGAILTLAMASHPLAILTDQDDRGLRRMVAFRADQLIQADLKFDAASASSMLNRWTRAARDVASDLIGKAPARQVLVYLPSRTRQAELDRRVLAGLPSWLQIGFAALLALGLIGSPTAWRWFSRLWPPEQAADYAGRVGYLAAWLVRAIVFAIVFMPLAAIVAAPAQLIRLVSRHA